MSDIQNNSYKTEVHEAADALNKLKDNADTDIAARVTALKAKSTENLTKLNTLMSEAEKNKIASVTDLQAGVNKNFKFEEYITQIKTLEESMDVDKKKLAETLISNLDAEFEKASKINFTKKTSSEVTPEVKKEAQKSDLERKKMLISELAKTDDVIKKALAEIAGSGLEQAPYDNKVLGEIYKSITVKDATKKETLKRAFDGLVKDSHNPVLRLNFLRIIHSLPEEERTQFSEAKMIAAENIWRIRMNHDKGPKGERVLPSTPWGMIQATDMQVAPDLALIPKVTTPPQPASADTKINDNNDNTNKTASQTAESGGGTNPETGTLLEWNDTNKEKIVNDAYASFVSGLKDKTIDLQTGKLTFQSMGKEFLFSGTEMQFGTRKVHYKLVGKRSFVSVDVTPLKLSASEGKAQLAFSYTPPLGRLTTEQKALEEVDIKSLLRSTLGSLSTSSDIPQNLDIPVAKDTNLGIVFSAA